MRVVVDCPTYPTEDPEKVLLAVTSLFPDLEFRPTENGVRAETSGRSGLEWLRSRIFERRIIDATRARLYSNADDDHTRLHLDKQAGLHGRVRIVDEFEEEPPLGTIVVDFFFESTREMEEFIKWIAPPTEDGRALI